MENHTIDGTLPCTRFPSVTASAPRAKQMPHEGDKDCVRTDSLDREASTAAKWCGGLQFEPAINMTLPKPFRNNLGGADKTPNLSEAKQYGRSGNSNLASSN